MKNRVLMFWLAVLFLFGGTMTIMYASGRLDSSGPRIPFGNSEGSTQIAEVHSVKKPTTAPTLKISEFQMTDQLGRRFHSDQLQGHIWVGSIFFANCLSTCRMQNAEVAKLQTEYGNKGVRFVSITCDPRNDTVVALANYARMFNANPDQWYFLTGDFATAERVGSTMFGITVKPETHSDRLVLIDRQGNVHSTHRSMLFEDVKKIREELDKLLAAQQDVIEQSTTPDDESKQDAAEQ